MKTREEYIEAVKVKLEEISPFDEPENFIADSDGASLTVKPIKSYIDKSIDEAVKNCLTSLPVTLLHHDIERSIPAMSISGNGVGSFSISPNRRFIRYRHPVLKRDITAFITPEDSLYLLQQNEYTRGGLAKPVAVVSSDFNSNTAGKMEIYSFPSSMETIALPDLQSILLSIDTSKLAGSDKQNHVMSPIDDYIVLECAALVYDILGDVNNASTCRNQYQMKLQAQLQ